MELARAVHATTALVRSCTRHHGRRCKGGTAKARLLDEARLISRLERTQLLDELANRDVL
eukprot:scaffold300447_cov33-Tisochrysis_lutea.AAC.1